MSYTKQALQLEQESFFDDYDAPITCVSCKRGIPAKIATVMTRDTGICEWCRSTSNQGTLNWHEQQSQDHYIMNHLNPKRDL